MLATSALLLFMGVHSPAVAQTEANLTTGVRDFSIQTRSFTAADGDVKDGCITPGGPYKLLRFAFDAKNVGKADVTIGPPPAAGQSNAIYVWSAAHGHHHVRDFNKYELVNDSSVTVAPGLKQAFCLMDSEKLYPGADPAKYACHNQGVTVGWKDVYSAGLACQFINITGIADGNYSLVAETNVSRVATEGRVYDNRVAQRLAIAGTQVTPIEPAWRPSVEVAPGDGTPRTPVVVARGANRYDLFYRQSDGRLHTKWQNSSGQWSAGVTLFDPNVPYSLIGAPAAYSAKFNWIDVFGRNASDNAIYHFYWRGANWGYYSMGGSLVSPPAAVAPSPNRGMVAAIGPNGDFQYRYWNGTAWTAWASLGGMFMKEAPTLVASGSTTIHAFARRPDRSVTHRVFTGGTWTPAWTSLSGNLLGRISGASWNVDRVDIVGRGTDSALYRNSLNGSRWTGWFRDDSTAMVGLPVVMSTAPNRLDVFYYYNDGSRTFYRQRHWNGSYWIVRNPSAVDGITAAVAPVVASWADSTFGLFHTLSNGAIRVRPMR